MKKNEEVLLRKTYAKLLKHQNALGMSDWNIKLAININSEKEEFAEVKPCYPTKTAKITLYDLTDLDDTLVHELMHCKVSGMKDSYEEALDKYHELVKDLITNKEESFVNEMTKVILK